MQQSNESLETFYSRLPEFCSHAKLKQIEEDLVKDLFFSNMHGSNIQMELLSEVRTSQQVLNYAINRERESKRINKKTAEHTPTGTQLHTCTPTNNRAIQHHKNHTKATPCRKCGNPFSLAHLQICPAKNQQCNICKKIGYYTPLCTAMICKK